LFDDKYDGKKTLNENGDLKVPLSGLELDSSENQKIYSDAWKLTKTGFSIQDFGDIGSNWITYIGLKPAADGFS